jgi:NADH-quinone oxidoreductase subunit C
LTAREDALAKLLPAVLTSGLGRVLDSKQAVIGADIDEPTCRVPRESVADVCRVLKTDPRLAFDYLRLLSVVDYVAKDHEFEAVYHLYSLERRHKLVVKARAPESDPWFPSVTGVWRGADWYEREMHDLFGVEFHGHPNLKKLILPDDFQGFPGRKDYPLYDYDEY